MPRARSRLPPDRRRAPRVRARRSAFARRSRRWLGRFNAALGIGGYIGAILARRRGRCSPCRCSRWPAPESAAGGSRCSRCSGLIPAIDAAVALVNRAVTRGFGATILPGLALRDGVPREPAHHGRRADPADDAGGARRADRAARGPPPRRVRTAIFISRCSRTGPTRRPRHVAGRRRAARRGRRRHRAPESPPRAGRRQATASSCCIAAASGTKAQRQWMGWERKRGKLHELNRLLRGATDTTFIGVDGQPPGVPAGVRYVITLDADTRLPRDTARRLIGKMAHPLNRPRFDARTRPRRRGLRRPAAARHAVAADRPRRLALPAHLLQPERHRSLRRRRLRRLPGSVRRRLLHRQGHLRRRRLRGGARRPRAGEHAAQPRSVRGHLRARRPRLRHRGRRGVSVALRRRRRAPASLGARRLAAAAVDPRPRRRCRATRQRRAAADRPLEDARQSAAHRCRRRPAFVGAARGLAAAAARRARLDGASCWRRSRCRRCSRCSPRSCRAARGVTPRSHLRALGADLWLALVADRAARHLPRASGVADGRRDRPHAVSPVREPPQPARMGHGRAGAASAPRLEPRRLLSAAWRRRRRSPSSLPPSSRWRGATVPGRSPLPFVLAVARGARRSRAGSACRRWSPAACRSPRRTRAPCGSIARRTWRFFETFVTPDGPHAAAGQFPGRPAAGRRAPDLADQSRPLSAVRRQRARLRLDGHARDRRAAGGDARDDAAARSASAATSTTGTTRATCGRSTRSTSRRSTAAIWPGI